MLKDVRNAVRVPDRIGLGIGCGIVRCCIVSCGTTCRERGALLQFAGRYEGKDLWKMRLRVRVLAEVSPPQKRKKGCLQEITG